MTDASLTRCFCGDKPGSVGNCPTHGMFAPTAAGRWIPVTERMPERSVEVFIWLDYCDARYCRIAEWNTFLAPAKWLNVENSGDTWAPEQVTHWAEIRRPE